MPDYLRRNEIWSDLDVWTSVVDSAVKEEIDFLRIGAELFNTFFHDNENGIASGVVKFDAQRESSVIPDSPDEYLYEFGYRFDLSEKQFSVPKVRRDLELLVRDGARAVAIAEDMLFFHGKEAFNLIPKQVKIEDDDRNKVGLGLLNIVEKEKIIMVEASSSERPQFFGDAIYDAVQTAIAKLTDHHGPYALILDPARFGDATTQLVTAALTSTRDRIEKQLERGIHKTAALPPNHGLFISLGGMPITRHVYRPAGRTDAEPDVLVSYLPGEDRGTHRAFRVFQRSQLVVHNPGAIVRFDFVLNNDH